MKLTLPQQDIYFEQQLYINEPIYNIGAKIIIEGEIDSKVFEQAYHSLIRKHDSLRISFINDKKEIGYTVLEEHNTKLNILDFTIFNNPETEVEQYIRSEFIKPFNILEDGLLHIFTLIKIKNDLWYFFNKYHHIIVDGWSTSLLFQRLVSNYNEIICHNKIESDFTYSYNDFVNDDNNYIKSKEFDIDGKYWIEKFKVLPENLLNKLNPNISINKSSRHELIIKREFYNQLNILSKEVKCNTFHLILAAIFIYFGKKHNNTCFAIGLPVLNRSNAKFKKTVGLFMGINPLKLDFGLDCTIQDLVTEIKNQLKQDYRHQRFPLGKLISELQLHGNKNSLFDITLSYEKQDYSSHFLNTKTSVSPLTHESERVALAMYVREFDENEDVKIDFDYNLNFFSKESIEIVTQHFENLLNQFVCNSNIEIGHYDYLSALERKKIIQEFNDTDYSNLNKSFIELFEYQVDINPNRISIKDNYNSYSYSETKELVNVISQNIILHFGDLNEPICVIMDRSANLILLLLGILKSGKSYIPIDPNFPKDRVDYIVKNSNTVNVVTDNSSLQIDNVSPLHYTSFFQPITYLGNIKKINLKDTAYIIYTSGTTGDPKGVEISHLSLLNFLISIKDKPGIDHEDLIYSVTTYSFDISILEFFVPLISGASVFVSNKETLFEPRKIIAEIDRIQPTIIQATPSFFQMLYNAGWKGGKSIRILCGGDLLSKALAEKLITSVKEVWNMYGPTETTIWSTLKKIKSAHDASIIGKPIYNTKIYILDSCLMPLPIDALGEIYIGGYGLAKGYYWNDDLTQQKFINSPFNINEKIYSTGDVGKWNNKGEIVFLGRNDNQLKIRGFRIELEEIESRLNKILETDCSTVIGKKDDNLETFLVSFLPSSAKHYKTEWIKIKLKEFLPDYMIPENFIFLDYFPLTPNGKVDRKSLEKINIQRKERLSKRNPSNEIEKKLLKLFIEVLNIGFVGIDENFFSLGGHSLLAVKLMVLIEDKFFVNIEMRDIFINPTIESLSKIIEEKINATEKTNFFLSTKTKELYKATPSQINIWLSSMKYSSSAIYNMFSSFELIGNFDLKKFQNCIINEIYSNEILRTNFVEVDGEIYQKTRTIDDISFKVINVDFEKDLNAFKSEFFNYSFDLESDLLLRVAITKFNNKTILLFLTHHIILDGVSLEIFTKNIISRYKNVDFSEGSKFQFKDYSEWYYSELKDNNIKNKEFWNLYLSGYKKSELIPTKNLGIDLSYKGKKLIYQIESVDIRNYVKHKKITMFSFCFTTISILLSKFSMKNDICLGTVYSGRNRINRQSLGMYVKTIPVRININKFSEIEELFAETSINLVSMENKDFFIDSNLANYFDILVVYQNPEFSIYDGLNFGDVSLKLIPEENILTRLPITFNFNESTDKLICEIDYNDQIYDAEIIDVIWRKLEVLINQITVENVTSLEDLHILLPEEQNNNLDIQFNF